MIKAIERKDLPACLEIFHKGYETVAVEFGLTEDNCPDRGRASLPYEKLAAEFDNGTLMYGYFSDDKIIGFLGMKMLCDSVCKLDDIIILPEYREFGYGKELLDFCKKKATELGAVKIRLGMIDDNRRLRKWYEKNGFANIGYKKYDGAPFTVGKMECIIEGANHMQENNNWVLRTLKDWNIALIGFADLSEIDENTRFGFRYGISISIALNPEIVANITNGPSMEYYNECINVSERLREASGFLFKKIEERAFKAKSISRQKQNEDFITPFPLKTLATRSGLGWIGKSAALVTEQYGNAIRLGGVLTDMPVKPGTPVNSSLCGDCIECVINCPGNAIIGNRWGLSTNRDELLDAPKCKKAVVDRGRALDITEGSCGVCLAVCPWTIEYIRTKM